VRRAVWIVLHTPPSLPPADPTPPHLCRSGGGLVGEPLGPGSRGTMSCWGTARPPRENLPWGGGMAAGPGGGGSGGLQKKGMVKTGGGRCEGVNGEEEESENTVGERGLLDDGWMGVGVGPGVGRGPHPFVPPNFLVSK